MNLPPNFGFHLMDMGLIKPDSRDNAAIKQRKFNMAGPSVEGDHYLIDPLARIDLPEIETLIEDARYFVLHAPRQTGKTTSLLALMEHLNRQGRYRALYCNIEGTQAARGNIQEGIDDCPRPGQCCALLLG